MSTKTVSLTLAEDECLAAICAYAEKHPGVWFESYDVFSRRDIQACADKRTFKRLHKKPDVMKRYGIECHGAKVWMRLADSPIDESQDGQSPVATEKHE